MKKLAVLLLVVWMSGCATAPSWEGFTDQEREQWMALGASDKFARALKQAGISADEAAPWMRLNFGTASEIIAWHDSGFSAASRQIKSGGVDGDPRLHLSRRQHVPPRPQRVHARVGFP